MSATWTGGTTTVILDPYHVVAECIEKAGRRVFGAGGETPGQNQLVFQAESPLSVAELVFRKSGNESSCFVRGQFFVSASPCRLECQIEWTAEQSLSPEVEIELSPGWSADRVLIRGSEDPLSWHPSPASSGSTKLRVAIPAAALPRKQISLVVSAISTSAGARGPLELPRIRPLEARIVDEAWVAWADQSTIVRPVQARGLAWIDPGQVPGLLNPREAKSNLRESLAWRWTAEMAAARVDREPIEQVPGASVRVEATLDPAKGNLTLDGNLTIVAGTNALPAIPIWVDRPAGSSESLFFDDPSGGRLPAAHPVDQPARAALGLPEEGLALLLPVMIGSHAEKIIHFHAEYSWKSGGQIPIVAVSRKYLQDGMIVVKIPNNVRSRFKASRLRILDASAGDGGKAGDPVAMANRRARATTTDQFAWISMRLRSMSPAHISRARPSRLSRCTKRVLCERPCSPLQSTRSGRLSIGCVFWCISERLNPSIWFYPRGCRWRGFAATARKSHPSIREPVSKYRCRGGARARN